MNLSALDLLSSPRPFYGIVIMYMSHLAWQSRIACCHKEQSNKDSESSLEKTEPAADTGKIKDGFIAACSNSAGALVDTRFISFIVLV